MAGWSGPRDVVLMPSDRVSSPQSHLIALSAQPSRSLASIPSLQCDNRLIRSSRSRLWWGPAIHYN